jgi:hypothetical protein
MTTNPGDSRAKWSATSRRAVLVGGATFVVMPLVRSQAAHAEDRFAQVRRIGVITALGDQVEIAKFGFPARPPTGWSTSCWSARSSRPGRARSSFPRPPGVPTRAGEAPGEWADTAEQLTDEQRQKLRAHIEALISREVGQSLSAMGLAAS